METSICFVTHWFFSSSIIVKQQLVAQDDGLASLPFCCCAQSGCTSQQKLSLCFAFCVVATFADYPCAAGIFVKRIRIGSCDTEWAHITTGLYLHQTSGYRLLSHTAPQHKRAHVPCKLCLCPITVLCVGQMNSRDIHACKLTSLKHNEFQELLHQAHKAIATQ